MNPSEKAKEIFLNAAEKTSAADRRVYLDAACGADAALRREVQDLLTHHAKLGSFLDAPASPPSQTVDLPRSEQSGAIIGPYKLIELIGEGGMGTVYLAQQIEPVRRLVAVKLIKAGVTPDMVRMSVGIESLDDILWDIDKALEAAAKA